MVVVGSHLWHGVVERVPVARPRSSARGRRASSPPARRIAVLIAGGFIVIALWAYLVGQGRRMTLDAKIPAGPIADEVGPPQVRDEAGQPGQQAQVHDHRRRHRAGRRVGGGVARRARLQRPELLHPGQPAARAQHRRAGRHQRREELPERRRQRLPALLRHGQGRRLPRARSQRLPARAAERQHHRPVRRAGRARSRASTAACSTTARSAARRSRARSTPAARPASSCCSAPTSR